MRIGFDFDKVFIDYPPMLPYFIIDFLYKGTSVFKKSGMKAEELHYRYPGNMEQKIRVLSHHPTLRKPIKNNITFLKKISVKKNYQTFLISSRFSFLKKRTEIILKKYKLDKCFDGIFFNFNDQQPHIFKEMTIKKLKIDAYVDDDLQLSLYLSKKMPDLSIYWVTNDTMNIKLPKNITPIKNLGHLEKYLP